MGIGGINSSTSLNAVCSFVYFDNNHPFGGINSPFGGINSPFGGINLGFGGTNFSFGGIKMGFWWY